MLERPGRALERLLKARATRCRAILRSGDVVHNSYIRRLEKVNDEFYSVEFATFEAVK